MTTTENGPADAAATGGRHTLVAGLPGSVAPRPNGPGAATVLEAERTKVVAFGFAAGQELREHAAHHPVLIQVLAGSVAFGLPDGEITLAPGDLLHLTPRLRHSVRALADTTLTVTMLLGDPDPEDAS